MLDWYIHMYMYVVLHCINTCVSYYSTWGLTQEQLTANSLETQNNICVILNCFLCLFKRLNDHFVSGKVFAKNLQHMQSFFTFKMHLLKKHQFRVTNYSVVYFLPGVRRLQTSAAKKWEISTVLIQVKGKDCSIFLIP